MANILEMDNCRAILSEIWDSGVPGEHVWGIYDIIAFKGIFGIVWDTCKVSENMII